MSNAVAIQQKRKVLSIRRRIIALEKKMAVIAASSPKRKTAK